MPRTHKPTSPARIEANRSNSTHSTGPRTPEGKARAAQNSRKHGFAASNFAIVRIEDLDAIANLTADLVAFYQPVNSQELFAVERISLAQQSLLRVAALESGLFANGLDRALERSGTSPILSNPKLTEGIEVTAGQNHNYSLASGFHLLAAKSNCWPLFLRYQAQTERLYRRAVEEFERLRALRDSFPNEPTIDAEPEETKPLPPPETDPNPVGWTPGSQMASGPDRLVGPTPDAAAALPPTPPLSTRPPSPAHPCNSTGSKVPPNSQPDPPVAPTPPTLPAETIAFHSKRPEYRSGCEVTPPPRRGVMSTKASGGRLHHHPFRQAFRPSHIDSRQAGYAFGFALLRAVLATADRLHACPPLGVRLGG